MKIAVAYENGEIFGHFGHTEKFKIYEVEGKDIKSTKVIDTNGSGHSELVDFLVKNDVDTLICGGIGGGAKNAINEAGIKLYGGVEGNADSAVNSLLEGKLNFNPNIHCDHHDHDNGTHSCGPHGCH